MSNRDFRVGRFVSAAVLFLLCFVLGTPEVYAADGENEADAPRIEVYTVPAEIYPNTDFVTVRVKVRDLPESSSARIVNVTLDAPPSSWLSTDFPIVEGTRLVELKGEMTDASFEFDYRFPVRGTYEVNAAVFERAGDPSSPLADTTRTLRVSEHPSDIRNAALLFASLFLLGLLSGVMVRRTAVRDGETPSRGSGTTTAVLLLLVSTAVLMSPLYGHGPGEHEARERTLPDRVENEHGTLRVDVPTKSPRVGELTTVNARFSNSGSSTPSPARFVLECVNLEEGYPVFRMTTVERSGKLKERIQFVDGAPHRVRVKAEPVDHEEEHEQDPSLLAGTSVDVRAIEPPTGIVVRMMSFLLGVFVIGMFGGYVSHAFAGATNKDSSPDPLDSDGE